MNTTTEKLIKVLVVDDSAYLRKVIKQMLLRSPFIEVVGTATNGKDALEMVDELKPDVVTLDLIMPEMDGITFLEHQMKKRPLPVVIVSIASETGDLALKALDLGAIDFLQKPTALATEKVFEIADELIEKVKIASKVKVNEIITISQTPVLEKELALKKTDKLKKEIVVIGVSTGGPQALKSVIPALPKDFPVPVAIVLHMPVGYTELYAQKLNEISKLKVVEAKEGDEVAPGFVLLAQAGKHMTFTRNIDGKIKVHLDAKPFDTPHRPSVDVLFKSAAEIYGDKTLAIIMTGMGSDGKEGAGLIKAKGGSVITEAESTCIVYGMPRSAVEAGFSDRSVPLFEISNLIMELI